MKTAQQAAARWAANTAGAGATWLTGIQSTDVDVMGKAVAQGAAAVAGYTASITSGAYARAVQNSGGTANWKAKSEAKQANFAVGVAAGAQRQSNAIQKIMAAMPGIVNALPARGPAGSPQNYARSAAVGTALHNAKGSFKG